MANQYKNEVIYSGQTLISLKEDTVTPNTVLAGETFHDRSGSPQTGALITHNVYDGLDSTSASDALSANQGRELNNNLNTIKLKSKTITGTTNANGFISLGLSNYEVPLYVTGTDSTKFNHFQSGTAYGWGGYANFTVASTNVTFVLWYISFANWHA